MRNRKPNARNLISRRASSTIETSIGAHGSILSADDDVVIRSNTDRSNDHHRGRQAAAAAAAISQTPCIAADASHWVRSWDIHLISRSGLILLPDISASSSLTYVRLNNDELLHASDISSSVFTMLAQRYGTRADGYAAACGGSLHGLGVRSHAPGIDWKED